MDFYGIFICTMRLQNLSFLTYFISVPSNFKEKLAFRISLSNSAKDYNICFFAQRSNWHLLWFFRAQTRWRWEHKLHLRLQLFSFSKSVSGLLRFCVGTCNVAILSFDPFWFLLVWLPGVSSFMQTCHMFNEVRFAIVHDSPATSASVKGSATIIDSEGIAWLWSSIKT